MINKTINQLINKRWFIYRKNYWLEQKCQISDDFSIDVLDSTSLYESSDSKIRNNAWIFFLLMFLGSSLSLSVISLHSLENEFLLSSSQFTTPWLLIIYANGIIIFLSINMLNWSKFFAQLYMKKWPEMQILRWRTSADETEHVISSDDFGNFFYRSCTIFS